MRLFFLFSVLYTSLGVLLTVNLREDPSQLLAFVSIAALGSIDVLIYYLKYLLVILAIVLFLTRKHSLTARLLPSAYALLGCLIFSAGFSLFKTAIPYIQPFYADPLFAGMDKSLHFGTDPWVLTHKFSEIIPAQWVVFAYFALWSLPASFLPMILAITDPDTCRQNRFLVLHVLCWMGLGNVVALAFSSVGPVYYDRLLETSRFPDLIAALKTSGISATVLGKVQDNLWLSYAENHQSIGSGISAFPSVHVGVATVFALYLAERSRYLAPVGILFLMVILFCSVYIGWHYAVDGYASILLIVVAWFLLRRPLRLWRRNVAIVTQPHD